MFSEDHNHLGCTIVHSAPCVGSELDFCGMLVTINDEFRECTSQESTPTLSHMAPRPPALSQVASLPAARPSFGERAVVGERAFVAISAPLDTPICRTDDEILELLMPRHKKPARVGTTSSHGSGAKVFGGRVDESVTTSNNSTRHHVNVLPSAQHFVPSTPPLASATFSSSFRQLTGPKASHLDIPATTHKLSSSANVPKSSAFQSAASDDFDDASKHLHQSFKQPRAAPPTYIVNSFEAFLESMKQGVLQLPLDLDPAELSKLYEKRHICIPDSFASLSEYASTFRSALWEGETFVVSGTCGLSGPVLICLHTLRNDSLIFRCSVRTEGLY